MDEGVAVRGGNIFRGGRGNLCQMQKTSHAKKRLLLCFHSGSGFVLYC